MLNFTLRAPAGLQEQMSITRSMSMLQLNDEDDACVQHTGIQDAEQRGTSSQNNRLELIARDLQVAPLFTSNIQRYFWGERGAERFPAIFSQRGGLGVREPQSVKSDDLINLDGDSQVVASTSTKDDAVFANTREPWSAFICGSQGSGKSHTLACLLENYLLERDPVSKLPDPLTAIVFHYDKFSSFGSSQICETAYLCSAGVRVRILVAPSSVKKMMDVYTRRPGLPEDCPRPEVVPFFLTEDQLTIDTIMTLMAVQETTRAPPLYISALRQILREMATTNQDRAGIDYREFRKRLQSKAFSREQIMPLELRLQLLDSLLFEATAYNPWDFEKGSLTIVDLSDQFFDENDACALFSICLKLFMENRRTGSRVVALDEAHKFLTKSCEAVKLTNDLISIIRQQRHLGTRVIVATQEPTLSPELLDLCNLSVIHRFNSPRWYDMIKNHLVGAHTASKVGRDLLHDIIALNTGEALVFCPTAVLDIKNGQYMKLRDSIVKVKIRARLTTDGGCSILSSDKDLTPVDRAQYRLPTLRPFVLTNGTDEQGFRARSTIHSASVLDPFRRGITSGSGTPVASASSTDHAAKSRSRSPSVGRSSRVQGPTTSKEKPQELKSPTQPPAKLRDLAQKAVKRVIKDSIKNNENNWVFGLWRAKARDDLNDKHAHPGDHNFTKKNMKGFVTDQYIQDVVIHTHHELKQLPPATILKQHPWFQEKFRASIDRN